MKILLCVTGGIASYKAIDLTSKLRQRGHEVIVLMTDSAKQFVTPLSFQALSRNDVHSDIFFENDPSMIKHIGLGDWADINIIAPATAHTIGKIAHGLSDNMVTATIIASTKPTFIAPAMNSDMYLHPAVQKNLETLKSYGYHLLEPGAGFLACGYVAVGRMMEPLDIINQVENYEIASTYNADYKGKNILITAGPTIETIDAVRYLTNKSTGRMGYSIAEAAASRGANVTLISGPTQIEPPKNVTVIPVTSAEDMFNAVKSHMEHQHIIIKSAAVADYTPVHTQTGKMKKQDSDLTLQLKRTTDILNYLGEHKTNQILVGFAAETEQVAHYAKGKLKKKNADVIIANNVGDTTIGFKSDNNEVEMFFKDGHSVKIEKMTKKLLAHRLLTELKSIDTIR